MYREYVVKHLFSDISATTSNERQRQGRGADPPDVAGGLAAHPAERALHIPERRQDDRP